MKRTLVIATVLAVIALPLYADSWTGWISDEHCAGKGAKAEHKGCALRCAERGAKLVFVVTDEKVYKLDKQNGLKDHLGHKVTVTGTVEGDTIKVESIAEAEAE